MVTNKDADGAKNATKFSCELCVFECSKRSNFDKHLDTSKHLKNYPSLRKVAIKNAKKYICKCSKEYSHRQGLYAHKKICTHVTDLPEISSDDIQNKQLIEIIKENSEIKKETLEFKNIILELIKSNNELQKKFIESGNSISNNNSHNIHNNSHNKTFNLQFFLNEQCKDAMNISDFVNTFDLQLEDLESVGELGYVEGVTKIIVDKLNSMDIYKRPMHCSDAKREILYVKDGDVWAKEERSNPKLRKAIKSVSFKNMKIAVLWSDTYPESKDGDSRLNDTYMKLIKESTGGNGEIGDSENKIIRRIAKEIVIDKMS